MWKRKCPNCGEEISYSRESDRNRAEKRNTNCRPCAMKSDKRNKKISESHKGNPGYWKGKKRSVETRKRMSEPHLGKNNSMYGKSVYDVWVEKYGKKEAERRQKETNNKKSESHKGQKRSDVTKLKMRLSRLKYIENNFGQVMPNSNPKATLIIRAKAKELGITDLRDAETPGGEFQVCGYFVDGFSKEKNIVFEYYESFHKKQTERDERRKREIIKELGCKFIEIREWKL